VRDEGVSYDYLPPAETVLAPPFINGYLFAELEGLELPVHGGRLWTKDGHYRETRERLEAHVRQNVLAVEMQAASLFPFAKARGVVAGVVAHVTNGIDQTGEFDKGPEEFGLALCRSICRAGTRVPSSQ
jgi:uridine phosphorylase